MMLLSLDAPREWSTHLFVSFYCDLIAYLTCFRYLILALAVVYQHDVTNSARFFQPIIYTVIEFQFNYSLR
jgi:hypothetical protein